MGFYSIAAGSLPHTESTRDIRRNMPNPVPVANLVRLAVDQDYAGQGIGGILLKNAIRVVLRVAQNIAIKAIIVHAISDQVKTFYLKHGFKESPMTCNLLMISRTHAEIIFQQ